MSNPYFSHAELACKCCGQSHMSPGFMAKLITIRMKLGFPLPLSSAYRCPKHNAAVSPSGSDGPHTTGQAVDVLVYGERAYQLVEVALAAGMTGIGMKQKGLIRSRFVHLDDLPGEPDRPRPWIWTY